MEIYDGAFDLIDDIKIGSDPKEMFKDMDVGLFVGGHHRMPGQERKDLLKLNRKIYFLIFSNLLYFQGRYIKITLTH